MRLEEIVMLRDRRNGKRAGHENDLMKYCDALCELREHLDKTHANHKELEIWQEIAIKIVHTIAQNDLRLSPVDVMKLHRILEMPYEVIYVRRGDALCRRA